MNLPYKCWFQLCVLTAFFFRFKEKSHALKITEMQLKIKAQDHMKNEIAKLIGDKEKQSTVWYPSIKLHLITINNTVQ